MLERALMNEDWKIFFDLNNVYKCIQIKYDKKRCLRQKIKSINTFLNVIYLAFINRTMFKGKDVKKTSSACACAPVRVCVCACVCWRHAATYLTYRLCVKSHPLDMAARLVVSLIYSWPSSLATPPPQHCCSAQEHRLAPSLFSCSSASAESNEALFWRRNCGFRLCFCQFQFSRRWRQHH